MSTDPDAIAGYASSVDERLIDWLLCAGTVKRASFRERVESAAAAGFAGITLFPQHYLDARREGLAPTTLRSVLADEGIEVHQIDPVLDWFGSKASKSEELAYEAARAVEARSINVAPAFAPSGELGFLVDCLGSLCMRAAAEGMSVDFEPLPWTVVPDLAAGLRIVDAWGRGGTKPARWPMPAIRERARSVLDAYSHSVGAPPPAEAQPWRGSP